jgi:hypothetical protein
MDPLQQNMSSICTKTFLANDSNCKKSCNKSHLDVRIVGFSPFILLNKRQNLEQLIKIYFRDRPITSGVAPIKD